MNRTKDAGAQARVFAAALRTWATIDADDSPTAVRVEVRQPPDWKYAATVNLTSRQHHRLLAFMRDDLAENRPGYSSPSRAAAVVGGLLAELAAAGYTRVTTADLVDAAPRIGRSRSWIAAHVTDLVDDGHLIETRRPGVFRIA